MSGSLIKDKGHTTTCLCRYEEEADVQMQPIRNPALEGGVVSTTLWPHIPPGQDAVLFVQEAGWA